MRQLRSGAVTWLGILCVLGLVASVVNLYVMRSLFDPDWFAYRVAASLDRPAVARVVAGQITDQIIASERDLTAYQPIIRGAVEYVVSSSPFRAVVQRAARTLHGTIISSSGQDIALTVADVGVVLQDALATRPDIAAKLPAGARRAVGKVDDWPAGELLARVLRGGHRLRVAAIGCLAVGLAAGAGGLLLARRKDRYLLRLGIGLAVFAFLVAAAARYGGVLVAVLASSPLVADLVRGIWPAFLQPLAIRLLILGGLGLVLVAAVTSLLEKVSLADLSREVARRTAQRHQRARWALLRGLVLTAGGLLILFHPGAMLLVGAVVGGSLAVFAGIQELFVTIVGVVRRHEPAWSEQGAGRSLRWSWLAVTALVVVLAGAGGVWIARSGGDAAPITTVVTACNGAPELCDRRLDAVAFPTTHNSMGGGDDPGWMFPNQDRGVRAQLRDGIRGFLIDAHYGVPVGDKIKTLLENEEAARAKYEAVLGKEGVEAALRIRDRLVGEQEGEQDVFSCHGFCELGAVRLIDLLLEMREFLIANPGEVLIIIIQDEGVAPADIAACFARSGLEEFVYRGPVTPPWPTLRAMVDGNQRVVVFAENDATGVPWYHRAFEVFQETKYHFTDPSQFTNAPGRGGRSGSLLLLNHWIETSPAPLPSNAEIVNAYPVLWKRASTCRQERGRMPNLVAVDFYATGDLFKVVRTLNGLSEPVPPVP